MISKRAGSLIIVGAQILLLLGVAGKYRRDQMTYPRVWLKAVPVDPESLTRGRYLQLRVQPPNMPEQVVPLFIAEHAPDPSRMKDLYVEVTVLPSGPVRAVQLGKQQNGRYVPLAF
jgi:hypothetical protein